MRTVRCSSSSISPPIIFPGTIVTGRLTPQWQDPGNSPLVDEYLRRQAMSAQDYAGFLTRLRRQFPDEPFLLIRYGDHQPDFAAASDRAPLRRQTPWRGV